MSPDFVKPSARCSRQQRDEPQIALFLDQLRGHHQAADLRQHLFSSRPHPRPTVVAQFGDPGGVTAYAECSQPVGIRCFVSMYA